MNRPTAHSRYAQRGAWNNTHTHTYIHMEQGSLHLRRYQIWPQLAAGPAMAGRKRQRTRWYWCICKSRNSLCDVNGICSLVFLPAQSRESQTSEILHIQAQLAQLDNFIHRPLFTDGWAVWKDFIMSAVDNCFTLGKSPNPICYLFV